MALLKIVPNFVGFGSNHGYGKTKVLTLIRSGVLKNVNKLVPFTLQDIYAVRISMSKCGDWIDRCKKKEKAFFS